MAQEVFRIGLLLLSLCVDLPKAQHSSSSFWTGQNRGGSSSGTTFGSRQDFSSGGSFGGIAGTSEYSAYSSSNIGSYSRPQSASGFSSSVPASVSSSYFNSGLVKPSFSSGYSSSGSYSGDFSKPSSPSFGTPSSSGSSLNSYQSSESSKFSSSSGSYSRPIYSSPSSSPTTSNLFNPLSSLSSSSTSSTFSKPSNSYGPSSPSKFSNSASSSPSSSSSSFESSPSSSSTNGRPGYVKYPQSETGKSYYKGNTLIIKDFTDTYSSSNKKAAAPSVSVGDEKKSFDTEEISPPTSVEDTPPQTNEPNDNDSVIDNSQVQSQEVAEEEDPEADDNISENEDTDDVEDTEVYAFDGVPDLIATTVELQPSSSVPSGNDKETPPIIFNLGLELGKERGRLIDDEDDLNPKRVDLVHEGDIRSHSFPPVLEGTFQDDSTAVNGCQRGSSCLRWNHCQIRKGKFAGMCQDDTFHVCCYLEDNEVDEDDDLLVPEGRNAKTSAARGTKKDGEDAIDSQVVADHEEDQELAVTNDGPKTPEEDSSEVDVSNNSRPNEGTSSNLGNEVPQEGDNEEEDEQPGSEIPLLGGALHGEAKTLQASDKTIAPVKEPISTDLNGPYARDPNQLVSFTDPSSDDEGETDLKDGSAVSPATSVIVSSGSPDGRRIPPSVAAPVAKKPKKRSDKKTKRERKKFGLSAANRLYKPHSAACAAAMKCVEYDFCSLTGYMSKVRLNIPDDTRKSQGVALMPCRLPTAGPERGTPRAVCCRDPKYKAW